MLSKYPLKMLKKRQNYARICRPLRNPNPRRLWTRRIWHDVISSICAFACRMNDAAPVAPPSLHLLLLLLLQLLLGIVMFGNVWMFGHDGSSASGQKWKRQVRRSKRSERLEERERETEAKRVKVKWGRRWRWLCLGLAISQHSTGPKYS